MRKPFQRHQRSNRHRSQPFHWRRLILSFAVSILLASCTLLLILSNGDIVPAYWAYISPPIFVLAGLLLPFLQWLFPLSSGEPKEQPPQPLPSLFTPPGSSKSPWNVPYRHNPYFTGRENLLKQLYETLHSEKAPGLAQPQAINGLSGIGKTQLAVEYAHHNRDEYQAILWTTAPSYETLFSDFVKLGEVLNLPEKDSRDQNITVEAVNQWLEAHSRWLLIIDNVNDLRILNDFLSTSGKGHILITTQTQATGTIAQPFEVTDLKPDDGALLLLRRAKIIPINASLAQASVSNRASAIAIAHLLNGLPLALDQAGAYIEETGCGLSGYIERYDKQRARILKERGSLSPEHPDSVTTTLSLSIKKVQEANPMAAELLRFFAFLSPSGIPRELIIQGACDLGKAFRDVAAHPQRADSALSTLYRYSLVRHELTTDALSIHRLVQVILKDEMNPRKQHQWAERAVRAVCRVFPPVEFATWQRCQQYISQALECMAHIEQWKMTFPEAALLLNRAGEYLYEHGQYAEVESLWKRALSIREKALGPDHPDTAQSFNNLAVLYKNQGNYEQAEPFYQRALSIREHVLGPDHPDTAESLNNLAALYENQGIYGQAELLYLRALSICEKVLGPNHPNTANSLNNLAGLYRSLGNYKQAELFYQRALFIREKTLGPDHPDTANSLNSLAKLYQDQSNYEQADLFYQRALAICEKALGPNHPNTAHIFNSLAGLYRSLGKYEQAEPLYQRALSIREKVLGPNHPDTANSLNSLAELYRNLDKYEQAELLDQRGLSIYEKALGPNYSNSSRVQKKYVYHIQKIKDIQEQQNSEE